MRRVERRRRAIAVLMLVPVGAVVGGLIGLGWYEFTRQGWNKFGYEFEGFTQIALGALLGATSGLFGGVLGVASSNLRARTRAMIALRSVIGSVLIASGISSIFMFIDADGPQGAVPYLLAAYLPLGILLIGSGLRRNP